MIEVLDRLVIGQIELVIGIAIGAIALGFAMTSLGTSMSFDLDLFQYANNVTNMSVDIQEDVKNKENFADIYSVGGTITTLGGVILLVMAYIIYKKFTKKK